MKRFGFFRSFFVCAAAMMLLSSAACSSGSRHTAVFQSLTEAEASQETSKEVTLSEAEEPTIPTLTEQPETPEIELQHYTNFGLISDSITIGNLRDGASTAANIIGRFYANTGMEILEDCGNGWYHVSSGGLEGYVSAGLVKTGNDAAAQSVEYGNLWVEIKDETLNVRMEPDGASGTLTRVLAGQTYRVTEVLENWYKISVGSEEGYVSAAEVTAGYTVSGAENWSQMDNITGKAKTVISWGMNYLGVPYVFGGTSLSSGIDCSYFTYLAMKQVGVSLPRLSKEQAQCGTAVASVADAVPGDLFFYTAGRSEICHVGIYIGDNKILHAAQSIGCVAVSTYNYCGEPAVIRRYF